MAAFNSPGLFLTTWGWELGNGISYKLQTRLFYPTCSRTSWRLQFNISLFLYFHSRLQLSNLFQALSCCLWGGKCGLLGAMGTLLLPFPPLAAQAKRCSCSLWESMLNKRVGLAPDKKLFFCFIHSLILNRAADKTEIRNT